MKTISRTFRSFAIVCILLTLFVFPVLAFPPGQSGSGDPPIVDLPPQPPRTGLAPIDIERMLPELLALAVVIFAVVAWFKQMGMAGRMLTGSAFALGFVLGVSYRYAASPMVDFAGWFVAVIFGLMAGAIATGAYKGAQFVTGNDPGSMTAARMADSKQTAKVVDAIESSPGKQI